MNYQQHYLQRGCIQDDCWNDNHQTWKENEMIYYYLHVYETMVILLWLLNLYLLPRKGKRQLYCYMINVKIIIIIIAHTWFQSWSADKKVVLQALIVIFRGAFMHPQPELCQHAGRFLLLLLLILIIIIIVIIIIIIIIIIENTIGDILLFALWMYVPKTWWVWIVTNKFGNILLQSLLISVA